jgi:hypothetical protein
MPLGMITFIIIDTIYQSIPKKKLFEYPMNESDWQWKLLSFNFSSIIVINYATFMILILFVIAIIIIGLLSKSQTLSLTKSSL